MKPRLLKNRGKWRIVWYRDRTQFAVYPDPNSDIGDLLNQITLALEDLGEWPSEICQSPAVLRYIGATGSASTKGEEDVIDEYLSTIKGSVSPEWAKKTKTYLDEFNEAHPLQRATPSVSQQYLAGIMDKNTIETRNRRLVVLSKFYKWAMRAHRWPLNPFAGLKQIKKSRVNTDIKYLSPEERDSALAAADTIEHGLSVWIALYAGLRRNEIWRLCWEAVNFESETIVAQSKQGSARTVPIASPLLKQLKKHRKPSGLIFSTKGLSGYGEPARRVLERLQEACAEISSDCLTWNPFRHTFCTLLVQAGVSIDKVAMWAGHDIKTCHLHYARFVPKDKKDSDIEKLG